MSYEPPQKGFRTFMQLLLLGFGTFVVLLLGRQTVTVYTSASETEAPQFVKVTNVTQNSVSISWHTAKKTTEYVVYRRGMEEEQRELTGKLRNNHHITMIGLNPGSVYTFKIGVGSKLYDDYGEPFSFETRATFTLSREQKAFGQIITPNNNLAGDAIVFVTIKDMDHEPSMGLSSVLSTITDTNGAFIINLGEGQERDNDAPFIYSASDQVELTVRGDDLNQASAIYEVNQMQPISALKLTTDNKLQDFTSVTNVKGMITLPQAHPQIARSEKLKQTLRKVFIRYIY